MGSGADGTNVPFGTIVFSIGRCKICHTPLLRRSSEGLRGHHASSTLRPWYSLGRAKSTLFKARARICLLFIFAAPDTPSLPSAAALPRLLLAYTSLPMARVSTVGRLVLAWVCSRLGAWENLSKSDILSESDILEDRLSAGTGLRDAGRRASFDERCRQHPPAETFGWRLSDR